MSKNIEICAIVAITTAMIGLSVLATNSGPLTLALAQTNQTGSVGGGGDYQTHLDLANQDAGTQNNTGVLYHSELAALTAPEPIGEGAMHSEQAAVAAKYGNITDAQMHLKLAQEATQ